MSPSSFRSWISDTLLSLSIAVTLLLGLAFASTGVLAQDTANPLTAPLPPRTWSPPVPLEFTGKEARLPLTQHVQLLEDPLGAWELSQIHTMDQGWYPASESDFAAAITGSAWWIRIALHNSSAREQDMVVDLGSAHPDHLHWYVFDAMNGVRQEFVDGDRLPYGLHPLPYPSMALPYRFAPGETITLYLRLDSQDGLHPRLLPTISGRDSFLEYAQHRMWMNGLLLGALGTLLVLHLAQPQRLRRATWALYASSLGALILWILSSSGLDRQLLWPLWPRAHHQLLATVSALTPALAGLFFMRFLRLQRTIPRWARLMVWGFIGLCLISAVTGLFDWHAASFLLTVPSTIALFGWLWGLSLWMVVRKASPSARYALAGLMISAIGMAAWTLSALGYFPTWGWLEWALPSAALISAVLLALGLNDAQRRHDTQNLMRVQQAHDHQQAEAQSLAQQLQDQVQAYELHLQTQLHALEQAQEIWQSQSQQLSQTDTLTGVANRTQFYAHLSHALQPETNQPLAICWLDIDGFSAYNEAHGLLEGDALLTATAAHLRANLPASVQPVQLFRIDNKRFAACWSAPTQAAALEGAQQLRKAFESLTPPSLESDTSTTSSITASLGVAWCDAQDLGSQDINSIHKDLSTAVRMAQAQGGNRVVTSAHARAANQALEALPSLPDPVPTASPQTNVLPPVAEKRTEENVISRPESSAASAPTSPAGTIRQAPATASLPTSLPSTNQIQKSASMLDLGAATPDSLPVPKGNRLPDRLPPRKASPSSK